MIAYNSSVIKTLRNPRTLSLAFELLDNSEIENFVELSVERLLFEHVRSGMRDGSGNETIAIFKHRLSCHAKEILNRINSNKKEDILLFESSMSGSTSYNLSPELLAVIEGRYFQVLPHDKTLYKLSDDGLIVALGISIIKNIQKAERNNETLQKN